MPLVTKRSMTPSSSTMPIAAYRAPISWRTRSAISCRTWSSGSTPAMACVATLSASSRSAVRRNSSRDRAASTASSMARMAAVVSPRGESIHSDPVRVRPFSARSSTWIRPGRSRAGSASRLPQPTARWLLPGGSTRRNAPRASIDAQTAPSAVLRAPERLAADVGRVARSASRRAMSGKESAVGTALRAYQPLGVNAVQVQAPPGGRGRRGTSGPPIGATRHCCPGVAGAKIAW